MPTKPIYYFFGIGPTGRSDFAILHDNGIIEMASWNYGEVYEKLINRGIKAIDLSRHGFPPSGVPKKRWYPS